MTTYEVDVVVVGLGPGGEQAAQTMAEAGLDVVGVEMDLVGGECPFYGCTPTKLMVRAATALAEARRVDQLAGRVTVEPDWEPVARRITDEVTKAWTDDDNVSRLTEAGVRIVRGRGVLDGPRRVVVGDDVYVARRGVIANPGTAPQRLPIDGLAQAGSWDNRDVVRLTELPSSVVVVGGGPNGCEVAQVFARFGVRTTLLEAADRLLGQEEPEASEVLAAAFREDGMDVRTGVEIRRVDRDADGVRVTLADGEVRAQEIVVVAGRSVNLDGLGLETAGARVCDGVVHTDERARAADGLWVIGDVTGEGAFTHISLYQADLAVADVLTPGEGPTADYRAVSRVTYTEPEVGSVGLTEAQAREQGLDVRTASHRVGDGGRGWLHGPGGDGVIKLVAVGDVLVGATSVGPWHGEVLSMLTLAVHARIPLGTLAGMHYAFPAFHRDVMIPVQELVGG